MNSIVFSITFKDFTQIKPHFFHLLKFWNDGNRSDVSVAEKKVHQMNIEINFVETNDFQSQNMSGMWQNAKLTFRLERFEFWKRY